jgi:hypothetical protein
MPLYLGSLLGGVAQGQDLAQQAEARKLQQQKLAYDFEQTKQANARALQAEQGASATFGRMFAPPPVSAPTNQGPLPPGPGQASMPAQPPAQQPPMMGPPQAVPNTTPRQPAAPQRPAIPPYQTVQSAGQQQQAMQGAQQAQQQQAMQAPPAVGVQPQQQQPQFTIQSAIQAMQSQGVPQEQWLGQLDKIKPYLDMQQRQQLAMLQEQDRQERLKNEDRRLTNQERNIDSLISKRSGAGGAGGAGGAAGGETVDNMTALILNGAKKTDVLAGRSAAEAAKYQTARNAAIKQLTDGGLTLQQATSQIMNSTSERESDMKALSKVTQSISAIRPYKEMFDKNTDVLVKLADKAIATNSAYANKSINELRTNFSDNPDVAKYLAQVRFVQTEAARLIANPNLTGVLSDSARHELDQILNGNMPLNATKGVLDLLKADGERRVSALKSEKDLLLKSGGSAGAGGGIPAGWSVKEK